MWAFSQVTGSNAYWPFWGGASFNDTAVLLLSGLGKPKQSWFNKAVANNSLLQQPCIGPVIAQTDPGRRWLTGQSNPRSVWCQNLHISQATSNVEGLDSSKRCSGAKPCIFHKQCRTRNGLILQSDGLVSKLANFTSNVGWQRYGFFKGMVQTP